MKPLLFIIFIFISAICHAQLPLVQVPPNTDIHFISPEPISYVDISVKNIIGDLPLKNVLRIRLKDSINSADAVITITGEKYIAQYHVVANPNIRGMVPTEIDILPADTKPLDISGVSLSQPQLKTLALNLFCKETGHPIERTKAFGLKASLYHVYSAGDYIFLSLGYQNKTNLKYDLDELRFKIEDKKITKATNVQSLEIKPEFVLFDNPVFQHNYRNIIVLKKLSFPGNKVLNIELSEKQISGRVITLSVSYKDVLEADTINF